MMDYRLGAAASCILVLCNAVTTKSQTTSVSGSCLSLDEGATGAQEESDEMSQNGRRGCGQGQVAVHVAALMKGQKMLRDQALTVSELLSESSRALATLSSSYQSLQNRTMYGGEQLRQQQRSSEQAIGNAVAMIAALQHNSTQLDAGFRAATISLAKNITALRGLIDEAEAVSRALVEREARLAWDGLQALNQSVVQRLHDVELAAHELRNFTEHVNSSFAEDVAAIDSNVRRLRQSVNMSFDVLQSRIEQLAENFVATASEANASAIATHELILNVAVALNQSLLRIYEDLEVRIRNVSANATATSERVEQLNTSFLEDLESTVDRLKQLATIFDRRMADFQGDILRLDIGTSLMARDINFLHNISVAQGAAIVEIEAAVSNLTRNVDAHAQLRETAAADLLTNISQQFSRTLEEEKLKTSALIRIVSATLEERLDNFTEHINVSQSEHVRYTSDALNNVSDSTERLHSTLVAHFDQGISNARTLWMSTVDVRMTERLDGLLANVTQIISEERLLHSFAVSNITSSAEARLNEYTQEVNQSQTLAYEYIMGVSANATRQIDKVSADLSESIDARIHTARAEWTNAIAELNASFNSVLTSSGAMAESLHRDVQRLKNSTSHSLEEYGRNISTVRSDLLAYQASTAAEFSVQSRALSQLDANLSNSSHHVNQKIQELVTTTTESSLRSSANEAAILQKEILLQGRIDRVSTESARIVDALNATLRAFVATSYQAEVSPVRQQVSQLQSTLQQTRSDLATLQTSHESLRRTARTQTDLDALSTAIIQQVRNILAECPAGWTARESSCYYVVLTTMFWEDARIACLALGGTLVEIENQSEDIFIKEFITSKALNSVWIGLHDRPTENQWQWNSGQPSSYRNWAPNEPNNSGEEDCAHAYAWDASRYGWNDHKCNQASFPSVCERRVR